MTVATVQLANGQTVKLGRIAPVASFAYGPFWIRDYQDGSRKVTLRLGAFYDTSLKTASAPLPESTNRREKATASIKRMYGNDREGCCVISSAYHQTGLWTVSDGPEAVVGTDAEVHQNYQSICGPGDNGCIISRVLDYRKSKGLPFNGVVHRIDDYVSVDWTNKELVKAAIFLFGSGPLGINLPDAWAKSRDGSDWDVTNTRNVGGHDVPVIDYDPRGVWIATWGGTRLITWAAFTSRKWLDEFDVVLSPDWYGADNLAPNGIKVDALRSALDALGNGQIPPIDVPPPPLTDWFV